MGLRRVHTHNNNESESVYKAEGGGGYLRVGSHSFWFWSGSLPPSALVWTLLRAVHIHHIHTRRNEINGHEWFLCLSLDENENKKLVALSQQRPLRGS